MIRLCLLMLSCPLLSLQQDTRLGLLAPGLGLPPVPGASNPNPGNNANFREDKCICIPPNQACQPESLLQPENQQNQQNQNTRGNFGLNVINIRIVNNRPTSDPCRTSELVLCCPGGSIPKPPPPSRPAPVIRPVRPGQSSCGVRQFDYPNTMNGISDFGEYPWMALALELNDGYIGGGVLIAEDFVLTAAHKVYDKSNIKVRLGEHDVTRPVDNPKYPHIDIPVSKIIIHPQFESGTLLNNIALLQLARPVNTAANPHIAIACLPDFKQLFDGQRCFVTGFGQNAFRGGQYQTLLKEVDVKVVEFFRCQELLRRTRLGPDFTLHRESFICAGGEVGKDACTGDGGSPLVCGANGHWTVAGLVAWGIECAKAEIPGVYVNVANYVPFIRQFVK